MTYKGPKDRNKTTNKIAALFVIKNGVYSELNLDCWDIERDARQYRGPRKVICHPPCKRWGKYWWGGANPYLRKKQHKGDDAGCFYHSIWCVRTFGGIIEHPKGSHAWDWFGLEKPKQGKGWTNSDKYGGKSCCVEQGNYGHLARKPTWLYAVNITWLELNWQPAINKIPFEYTPKKLREITPLEFAKLLIKIVK